MTAPRRALAGTVALLLAAGAALLAPTSATATATATNGTSCVAGPLEKAPTLVSDLSPEGAPVRETALADGTSIPVVMVHGWTGRSMHNNDRTGAFSSVIDLTANNGQTINVGRSLIGQVQDAGGTSVYTFDYHEASARWVTDATIAPKLAEAITCLSALHGHPVVLMVHSMGGLATRQALDLIQQSGQANTVSDVVTFGTPNTGSWLASVVEAEDTAAQLSLLLPGAAGASINVVRSILVLCGTAATNSMENLGVCGLISPQFWSARSAAGRALRIDSPEIRALAPWPDDVRVHALGGSIDLEIARTSWFNLSTSVANVNVGDFVVGVDSATRDATDSHAIECFYTVDLRAAAADIAASDWFKLKAAAETRDNVYTNGAGSACAHSNLMRSIELTNDALGVIVDIVDQANATMVLPTDLTGQNLVIVEAYDPSRNVLTVDLVRYIAHDELIAYYAADPEQWSELYCDNGGYYDGTADLSTCSVTGESQIALNENPALRELSLSSAATFTILEVPSVTEVSASKEQFAAAVQDRRLGAYYWITVDGGGAVVIVDAHFFS